VRPFIDEGVADGQAADTADERTLKSCIRASLSLPVYSQTMCYFTGSISSAREPTKDVISGVQP
jgi:hypothetical protein